MIFEHLGNVELHLMQLHREPLHPPNTLEGREGSTLSYSGLCIIMVTSRIHVNETDKTKHKWCVVELLSRDAWHGCRDLRTSSILEGEARGCGAELRQASPVDRILAKTSYACEIARRHFSIVAQVTSV